MNHMAGCTLSLAEKDAVTGGDIAQRLGALCGGIKREDQRSQMLQLILGKRKSWHATLRSVLDNVVNLRYCAPSEPGAIDQRRSTLCSCTGLAVARRTYLHKLASRRIPSSAGWGTIPHKRSSYECGEDESCKSWTFHTEQGVLWKFRVVCQRDALVNYW